MREVCLCPTRLPAAEAFGQVRPAASLLQVAALADPAMLVEIEAVAVI